MLGNYFTLVHVSRFIHQQCIGHTISELYSQHEQQLCITVESLPVQTIIVSCMPSENYVTIRDGSFRARKNSVGLFPKAAGKKILERCMRLRRPDRRYRVRRKHEHEV